MKKGECIVNKAILESIPGLEIGSNIYLNISNGALLHTSMVQYINIAKTQGWPWAEWEPWDPYTQYKFLFKCKITHTFGDKAFGKIADGDGHKTIFMEWKFIL